MLYSIVAHAAGIRDTRITKKFLSFTSRSLFTDNLIYVTSHFLYSIHDDVLQEVLDMT